MAHLPFGFRINGGYDNKPFQRIKGWGNLLDT